MAWQPALAAANASARRSWPGLAIPRDDGRSAHVGAPGERSCRPPEGDQRGGGRQDRLPPALLPLRPPPDRDVLEAVPRDPGDEPAAHLATLQTAQGTLEALREAAPRPHRQVDVKFIAPIAGSRKKHYQFTAIDDCTRLRVLRLNSLNQVRRNVDFVLAGREPKVIGLRPAETKNARRASRE
jgi:hypothetical protein